MMDYAQLRRRLRAQPRTWLVTGVAGFIGSHLLETLLDLEQRVVGLDNFATGTKRNIAEVLAARPGARRRFQFIEGDCADLRTCERACAGVDCLLHQAALGSVPRSLADPIASHTSNLTGSLNLLVAARSRNVRRVVYASSSAVYGDDPALPKREAHLGRPLSPYAVTKLAGELYAGVFHRAHGLETIGLRYFNVFGPRQDPNGPYAAVIPRWVAAMMRNEPAEMHGDGSTSRDFCYVANVVQANLRAALTTQPAALGQAVNIACHARTSLTELFERIRRQLAPDFPHLRDYTPRWREFRAGDIRHSQADIRLARTWLGYAPTHDLDQGLAETLDWYRRRARRPAARAGQA